MSQTPAPEASRADATAGPGGHPATPDYPDHIDGAVLKIAGVVVLGAIMSILDMTVVNVAMPTFQKAFAENGQPLAYSTVAWTATAYILALATVIPLTGWAADRFGTKRLYLMAVFLFTVGSVLCAMAGSIGQLVAFRVLQGLGGGMLMPLGMTIMTKAAGPKRMGRLMAILGIPMLLGPIGGPILGGWLIEHHSWHWIFLINLPIGLVAIVYALWALPKDAVEPSESLDVVGLLLMSPGLALLLYGISSIPEEKSFFTVKVGVTATIGVLLIVAFVLWTFRITHPLLQFRLFGDRNLRTSSIVMFMFTAAFFGALFLVPTYFQMVRGEGVTKAGVLMIAQGLGAMITMPIAGSLVDKHPVGRIVPVGILLILIGMAPFMTISDTTAYPLILGALFVMGLGMGMTMMPVMTSALKTLRSHDVARGSTMLNIIQQVGSSIGIALMSVLLTNGMTSSALVGQAQTFGEEAARLGDNAQAKMALLPRFPEVAKVLKAHAADPDHGQAALAQAVHHEMAPAFAHAYVVAVLLVAAVLIASAFLPRRREVSHFGDDQATPVLMH